MMNVHFAGACGLYCGACEYRATHPCAGCGAIGGRPAWVEHVGRTICSIYECCIDRDIDHCGMCGDLPCDMFLTSHDPSLNEQEAEEDIRGRVRTLRRRKEIGTREWVREQGGEDR